MGILGTVLIISGLLSIFALLTNPFSRFSFIALPYKARFRGGKLVVTDTLGEIRVRQNILWRVLAIIKSGTHIMHTRYVHSPRSRAKSIEGVIRDVHDLRYNPKKLLLISGDHFSGLFVRNLGVFLYPVMDTHFGISIKDWERRQAVYLQTVAYALGVFAKQSALTTTIMPTNRFGATCVNFYAYPSDTLYGMLFALAALLDEESAQPYAYGKPQYKRQTQLAAGGLLQKFGPVLTSHYAAYRSCVFDENELLIKRTVHLSGAKDITRRACAFYDNVIFWKTTELAMKLGIITEDKKFLRNLKKQIRVTFWLPDEGYFQEDLSSEGVQGKYYSSDWLIVLTTGFLDITKPSERLYYERSVSYIQRHGIDQPFAIKYQNDTRAQRQFLPVRIAVASYGGDAVWSFWGMEYIKVLLALGQIDHADKHITAYAEKMVQYGGFPEVYDNKGNLLRTRMYQSICQTSWVIGYEQVIAIRNSRTPASS